MTDTDQPTALDLIAAIDEELATIPTGGDGDTVARQIAAIHAMQLATERLAGQVEDLQDIARRHAADDAQDAWDAQHPIRAMGREAVDGLPTVLLFIALVAVAALMAISDGVELTSGNVRIVLVFSLALAGLVRVSTWITRRVLGRRASKSAVTSEKAA
jgi:hypothetical protein